MNVTTYAAIDEKIYDTVLPNGLKLFIIPKPGFHKTYVTLTTKFGSLQNEFIPYGETEQKRMPEGIAHFLEHKMFEKEHGDMFNMFSEQGASANAFTSYDRTSYLFTAVDRIEENIDTLLQMVQQPYFSQSSVEKEMGIIAEEIRMYQDQPNYKLYYQTLAGMYQQHAVKQDIAGTVDSINEITAETLYACYHTFYRPENMVMFVVGNVDPEATAQFIAEHQYQNNQNVYIPQLTLPTEPKEVLHHQLISQADISRPKLMLGVKSTAYQHSQTLLKTEMAVSFILELLLGEQTDFYQSLQQDGLIDESFGFSFTLEPTFSHILIAGTTNQPDELKSRIIQQLQQLPTDVESYERIVRQTIGDYISSMNSVEYIANQYTRYYFNDADLFELLPILEQLSFEQCIEIYKDVVDLNQLTDSRLMPRG